MTEPSASRFDNYSLAQIHQLQGATRDEIATQKVHLAELDAEIYRRFEKVGYYHLAELGKEGGSTTFDAGGEDGLNFKVKASISKSVKWDGAALQKIASGMTWEEIQHYFKISFSMAEAIYKALPPGDLKKNVEAARTTKYADMKVELVGSD